MKIHGKIWSVLAVFACVTVFPVSGMEMGGFDIEIGTGEQNEFLFEQQQSGGQENVVSSDNISSIADSGNSQNVSTGSETGEAFASDHVLDIPDHAGSSGQDDIAGNSTQGNVQNSSGTNIQAKPERNENNVFSDDDSGSTVPDTNQQDRSSQVFFQQLHISEMPQEIKVPNTDNATSSSESSEVSVEENRESSMETPKSVTEKVSEKTSTPIPDKLKSHKQKITAVPSASPHPTLLPDLMYYDKSENHRTEKIGLCMKYWKEKIGICQDPKFQVISNNPVYVLSARIDRKECAWNCKDGYLILEGKGEEEKSIAEVLILYEETDDVKLQRIQFHISSQN